MSYNYLITSHYEYLVKVSVDKVSLPSELFIRTNFFFKSAWISETPHCHFCRASSSELFNSTTRNCCQAQRTENQFINWVQLNIVLMLTQRHIPICQVLGAFNWVLKLSFDHNSEEHCVSEPSEEYSSNHTDLERWYTYFIRMLRIFIISVLGGA